MFVQHYSIVTRWKIYERHTYYVACHLKLKTAASYIPSLGMQNTRSERKLEEGRHLCIGMIFQNVIKDRNVGKLSNHNVHVYMY